jgi:hypothetical protein
VNWIISKCEHLLASQLLPQNRLLGGVHSVKLENVFRRIHTNSANLFHGRPPLSEIYSDLILARLMPSGAVHTNRRQSIFGAARCTDGAERVRVGWGATVRQKMLWFTRRKDALEQWLRP